eukprot:symbB.v1.2.007887.t2/scaffold489.1/size197246/5
MDNGDAVPTKRRASSAQSAKKRPRGLQRLRSFSKGLAYAHSQVRGDLLGRSVALILCGEAHEDVLDLTRKKCIIEPEKGWHFVGNEAENLGAQMATKDCATLKAAQNWAAETVDDAEESEEDDLIGAKLIFQPGDRPGAKGTARVYRPSQPWHRHSPHLRPHRSPQLGPRSPPLVDATPLKVFEWSDMDKEADNYNKRRLRGEEVPVVEYDALIASRKEARLAEGIELFDDWLLRHAHDPKGRRLEILIEAHVPARFERICPCEFAAVPSFPDLVALDQKNLGSVLANKLSGALQKQRRKKYFGRKMSTAMDFKTPGLPIYEVFPGVGMTPTILVTSEPLPSLDLIQWQFLGKAPAHMPMHQVVHSLQRRLAERSVWAPQMIQTEFQIDGTCGKLRDAYQAYPHGPLDFVTNPGSDLGSCVDTKLGYMKAPKNMTLEKYLNISFPAPIRKQKNST